MDASGLPLVSPPIDWREVDAISRKRLLCFLNHFVAHTIDFLNDFARSCERRLDEVNGRLQKTEATLAVLEAKLDSIPGLEGIQAKSTTTTTATTTTVNERHSTSLPKGVPASTNVPASSPNVNDSTIVPSETADSSADAAHSPRDEDAPPNAVRVKDDPRYAKYLRMLQMGVPPPAVKLKMGAEDPSLKPEALDTPNGFVSAEPAEIEDDASEDGDEEEEWSDG